MYVNVVFVIRCLYSAVSLTLVKNSYFKNYLLLLLLIEFHRHDPRSLSPRSVATSSPGRLQRRDSLAQFVHTAHMILLKS